MGGTALSPLEQLSQQTQSQEPKQAPASSLSPLEQLTQQTQKQQPKTDQPNLVDGWVANPNTVPNARIRNLPNPAEGLTPGQALVNGVKTGADLASIPAAASGLGEIGAALNPNYGTVGGAIMSHLSEQAAEWAQKYPTLVKLMVHAGVPSGVGGVIGYLIHKAK